MFEPPKIPGQPAYRLHKQSGRAIVTLPQPDGSRRDVILGVYGSPESVTKWQRELVEWDATKESPAPPVSKSVAVTVAELVLRYWEQHVITYYLHPDGRPTSEREIHRHVLRSLRLLHGDKIANELKPSMLETWQQQVIKARTVFIRSPDGR